MKYITIPDDVIPLAVDGKPAFAMIGVGKGAKKEMLRWGFLVWLGGPVLNDPKLEKTGRFIKMGDDVEVKIKECLEDGKPYLMLGDDEWEMLMIAVDEPTIGYSNAQTKYGEGGSIVVGGGRQMSSFIRAMERASDKKPANSKNKKKATRKKATKKKPTRKVAAPKRNGARARN